MNRRLFLASLAAPVYAPKREPEPAKPKPSTVTCEIKLDAKALARSLAATLYELQRDEGLRLVPSNR